MSNPIKSYFYAPSWDFPPSPKGPIKLGNVITSVGQPERPLHTAPYPNDKELILSEKKTVEYSKEKVRAGKFSILTKFLSILGLGVDLGVNWDKSDEELFTFSQLLTTQFIPNTSYIQKCVEAEPVSRFLQKSRFAKPVYVITGIKTVMGAKAKNAKTRAFGGGVGVDVDGTLWSGGTVPVSGGPEFELNRKDRGSTSWEESSDFVFAFRVVRVTVRKKTGEGSAADYRKGAMLDSTREERDRGVPFLVEAAGDF